VLPSTGVRWTADPLRAEHIGVSSLSPSLTTILSILTVRANTAVSLSFSPNPFLPGMTLAITATVRSAAPTALTPLGTVQFKANGSALGAAVPLSAGAAQLSLSGFVVAGQAISADYAGDTIF